MKEFLSLFSNIKGGPISTILGTLMFLFGAFLIYGTYRSDNSITWASVETGIFGIGGYLLVISDNWIKSLFKQKNE
jgi:hypothetical protein